MFHDGQAQAGTTQGPGTGFIDAVEALEKAGQVVGGNAGAGIADEELDAASGVARGA